MRATPQAGSTHGPIEQTTANMVARSTIDAIVKELDGLRLSYEQDVRKQQMLRSEELEGKESKALQIEQLIKHR